MVAMTQFLLLIGTALSALLLAASLLAPRRPRRAVPARVPLRS